MKNMDTAKSYYGRASVDASTELRRRMDEAPTIVSSEPRSINVCVRVCVRVFLNIIYTIP